VPRGGKRSNTQSPHKWHSRRFTVQHSSQDETAAAAEAEALKAAAGIGVRPIPIVIDHTWYAGKPEDGPSEIP